MQENLEQLINSLHGDILAVVPHVRPTFQFMGATSKTDYLLVVEKVR
jgi:rhamnose utilization protein RhaD (predicted bifunctional aldolase and dehydrogenase)